MNLLIETHCHSHYSHDCKTSMQSIGERCRRLGINFIVINDHDTCGVLDRDEAILASYGVTVIKGIEFTTKEGAHIIGIHSDIKSLENERGYYSLIELVNRLSLLGAKIIVPHPEHYTGLLGCGAVDADVDYVLRKTHFVEKENFKYGPSSCTQRISENYPNVKFIVGSDAHSIEDVGSQINSIVVEKIEDPIEGLYNSTDVEFVFNKRHGNMYWAFRHFQASKIYQLVIRVMRPELRRRIKRIFMKK